MNNIGLEINKEKSATNDPCCEDTATLLKGIGVYKYLGIIEDSRGIPTSKSFEEVQTKPIARVERLCCTRLNSRNIFQAINQPAISLLNYHISVHRLEPADFSKLDDAGRAVLVRTKYIYAQDVKNVYTFHVKNLEEVYIVSSSKANICFCNSWIAWKNLKKHRPEEQQS
ncbi:hypothetical protein LUQ84_000877 [Hamiltosporidium tvaerminnensis]|nr:hypothetical protein LUQ84_000877 [Hamiltosporidium tvaerminnensis]